MSTEWDLSDLEVMPPDTGSGMKPMVTSPTSFKKCRCCDRPVYSPHAVYCSPKSTCRVRYHRHPERYVKQLETPVSSVAAMTPDEYRRIIREEIAAALGGSTRTPLEPVSNAADLAGTLEIRADQTSGNQSTQNLLNCLFALQSGTGEWAKLGAKQ